MKRLIAGLLTIAMVVGIFPVDVLKVKAAEAPVKIEDTSYGILDTSVKGKKITLGQGYSLSSHKVDYVYNSTNFGEGYVIVRDDSTSTFYLIGTNGIVRDFYTESGGAPRLERLFEITQDTLYAIYRVKNPETGKYDIYNANTNTYYEYGLDECYTLLSTTSVKEGEYGSDLIYAKKDGKYGLVDCRGIMIYRTIYNRIDVYENCLVGWTKDDSGSVCAILSADGSADGECFYDTIENGVYKENVLAVKNHGKYALLNKNSLKFMTDFKYSSISFMTYENRYYAVCNYWEETTDKYQVTEDSVKVDVYASDGTKWSATAEYGGIGATVDIKGDWLKVYVTDTHVSTGTGNVTGEVHKEPITKNYLVTPDNKVKYIFESDSEDDLDRIKNTYAYYGKLKIILNREENCFYICDEKDYPITKVVSNSWEKIGKYLVAGKYERENAYTYVICDTMTGELLYDGVYIRNDIYDKEVIVFAESSTSDKFGILDVEAGKFSGYKFDGNEPQYIDKITNGHDKVFVIYEDKYYYINQDFEIVSTADGLYNASGCLAKSGDKLLVYNGMKENYYEMSVLDYDKTVLNTFVTPVNYITNVTAGKGYYHKEVESYKTINLNNGDIGLVLNDGRTITDQIHQTTGSTKNGLTFVEKDGKHLGVIDNNGNALLYGKYYIDDYRERGCNQYNFLSVVKDESVYLYDFTDCHGYGEAEDAEIVTEEDLFGEYNRFLDNAFYNSMCNDIEVQMANVLSHYGHSAKVVAFAKSALDGKTKYLMKKLLDMIPGSSLNEKKAYQDMALEYIKSLDTDVAKDYIKEITEKKKIADKIRKTLDGVTDLARAHDKSRFVEVWSETDEGLKSQIFELVDEVQINEDKLKAYSQKTGRIFTTLDYCTTYLTIYMIQEELVAKLMELVPADSELYDGLSYIHFKQQKLGPAGLVGELLTEEVFKYVADAAEKGLLKLADVKYVTLVGAIIDISCEIASKCIDSPDLEEIDKAILAFANALTLNEALTDYREKIEKNYKDGGAISTSVLRNEYSLLCNTYYNSLFIGLEHVKGLATDEESAVIERCQNDYAKKLIFRSYIGTCLLNARANWEYTVKANKAVISKLKAYYPTGVGRVPITELYEEWFDEQLELEKGTCFITYTIDVPKEIDGYEVDTLNENAFYGEQNISGVYVPDSIENINNKTFQGCKDIILFVGANDDAGTKYKDIENVTTQIREKEVVKLEIISVPQIADMKMQDEVNTDGLKIRVVYADGTTTEVEGGFYCDIVERKVGENEVSVCYGGCEVRYPVQIVESECEYSVSYQDEVGTELAEKVTGTAIAGTTIDILIPEIEGYEPITSEQSVTIGYENNFVVVYKEKSKISITSAVVEIADQKFAYANLTPEAKVTLDGKELVSGVDYKISYSNNYYAGEATAFITGLGVYEGHIIHNFRIIEEGHDWGNWEVIYEPEGDYYGLKVRVCKSCGDYEELEYKNVHEHKYQWKTTKKATTNYNGKQSYVCSCGKVKSTKVISATGKYKVTYKLNGGTNHTKNPVRFNKTNKALKLYSPTKKGYTFKGWYTSSKFKSSTKLSSIKKNTKKNVTIYAKWEKTKYKITYYLNKGKNSTKNPKTYYVTTSTIKLKSPTRKGYKFAGWYKDSKYKKKVTKITKGSTGNIKLYAKWVKK